MFSTTHTGHASTPLPYYTPGHHEFWQQGQAHMDQNMDPNQLNQHSQQQQQQQQQSHQQQQQQQQQHSEQLGGQQGEYQFHQLQKLAYNPLSSNQATQPSAPSMQRPPIRPLSRHIPQNPAAQFGGILSEHLVNSLLSNPNLDEGAQALWRVLLPALSHPEQRLILLTPNGALLWLSAYEQQVLLRAVRSEAEIDSALQHFVESGQVESLCSQLWWQLSLRSDAVAEDPSLASLSPVSVVSHGQPCLARSTLLLLGNNYRIVMAVLTPVDHSDNTFCYESARQSAVQYNTEWNDYLASCRNEQYDSRVPGGLHPMVGRLPETSPMPISQQQQGKRDFFTVAQKPDLAYYYGVLSRQHEEQHASPAPELLAKLVVDDHVYDPDHHPVGGSMPQQLGAPGQYVSKGLTNVISNRTRLTGSAIVAPSAGGQAPGPGTKMMGDKKCLECGAEKSPEWRKGPAGPKTLCNACGLRYAKRLRGN